MMELLYDFWGGMILHLWQSTLILLPLFLLERALAQAPAKVSHAFWSVGLIKLFLPMSFFGIFTGWLSRSTLGASTLERIEIFPPVTVIETILNPAAAMKFTALSAEAVSDWVVLIASVAWGACVLYLAARLVRDLLRASRYYDKTNPPPDNKLSAKLKKASARAGIPAGNIILCRDLVVPSVFGLLNPKILVPERVVSGLSEEELRAVLLHEETHRRRFDPLRSIVYRAGLVLFFFYPLLIPILRRLQSTAEFACDEGVIQFGVPPSTYSQALIKIVRMDLIPCVPAPAAAGRNKSILLERVKRLTTLTKTRQPMSFKHRLTLFIAALLVAASTLYPVPMTAGDDKSPTASLDIGVMASDENTTPPELLKSVLPEYPATARQYGFTAGVILKVVIDAKGRVKKADVHETYVKCAKDNKGRDENLLKKKTKEISEMFEKSALRAVIDFEFVPANRDGKPVESTVKIPFEFNLDCDKDGMKSGGGR